MIKTKTFRKGESGSYKTPSVAVVKFSSEQPFLVTSLMMFNRESNHEGYKFDDPLTDW